MGFHMGVQPMEMVIGDFKIGIEWNFMGLPSGELTWLWKISDPFSVYLLEGMAKAEEHNMGFKWSKLDVLVEGLRILMVNMVILLWYLSFHGFP